MVLYGALVLFLITYPLVDSRHSSGSRSRILLWAGSYLRLSVRNNHGIPIRDLVRLLRLSDCFPVLCGHSIISLEENELFLPSGRIMFANKLQKSGESLQNRQRANRTGTGTVKISLGC